MKHITELKDIETLKAKHLLNLNVSHSTFICLFYYLLVCSCNIERTIYID